MNETLAAQALAATAWSVNGDRCRVAQWTTWTVWRDEFRSAYIDGIATLRDDPRTY